MDDQPSSDETRRRLGLGAGLAIGMGTGVAIGASIDNMGLGIAIGVAIGAAVAGSFDVIGRRRRNGSGNGDDGSSGEDRGGLSDDGDEPNR